MAVKRKAKAKRASKQKRTISHKFVKSPRKTRSIRRILRGSGHRFVEYNGRSVGVQGDGRVYGPVIIIAATGRRSVKKAGELATRIINETPGITRVMFDITPR